MPNTEIPSRGNKPGCLVPFLKRPLVASLYDFVGMVPDVRICVYVLCSIYMYRYFQIAFHFNRNRK